MTGYRELHRQSIADRETFWRDESALVELCRELVAANPKLVADVKAGKQQAAGAFVGQAKKKKTVVMNRDHTVQVSRDEDGRTRTRIIIQKRSYLDPGTETFPGERVGNTGYIENPNQYAGSVLNNTSAGLYNTQSALPGPWTLPSKRNPWIGY